MLARVDLEDRADRGVDLGVHQDDVLAVRERLEDDLGAELHRAGDVDEHVDLRRAGEQHRVLGHHRAALANRRVSSSVCVPDGAPARGRRSGRRSRRARAGGCRSRPSASPARCCSIWLVSPWPMKPAPTMPTRIGLPCCLARPQRGVDDDHDDALHPAGCQPRRSTSSSGLPGASFSEMTATGSGHSSPSRGSYVRQPALGPGRVELADLVAGLGVVLERLVAVGEALRARRAPGGCPRSSSTATCWR